MRGACTLFVYAALCESQKHSVCMMQKKMHLLAPLREDSSTFVVTSAQRWMYATLLLARLITFSFAIFFMKVDSKPCKCVIVNINKQWLLPLFHFFFREDRLGKNILHSPKKSSFIKVKKVVGL
jgi:hypothetical protein